MLRLKGYILFLCFFLALSVSVILSSINFVHATEVSDAHKAGLLVHPYTFRSDSYFLSTNFTNQPNRVWSSGQGNWEWSRSKIITGDFQGSGKTDIAVLYDYPNSETGLWLFTSDSNFKPNLVWRSGQGNWEWSRSKIITGDFQGSGKTDIAVLYDYPNSETGLWLFTSDSNFKPNLVWRSGQGNWEWSRSKIITGDFQGSGKTDIAVLYDYPNSETGLWLFNSDSNFKPNRVWSSGQGNWEWSRSKVITGDFQGSGKTDIAVLYDYPNSETGLWLFNSDSNFKPNRVWSSGQGNWEWSRSKVITGDFQGSGKTDIAVLYDYPNSETGLWLFNSDSNFKPNRVWSSGQGNWEWSSSNVITGDFQGSGKTDIAVLYKYPNSETGLWLFNSDSNFKPNRVWSSGQGNWEWSSSKVITGDFQGDNKTEIAVLYNYPNSETGLWIFSRF